MHTFKLKVAETELEELLSTLDPQQTLVLSETNSGNCYFIMPADNTETLLNLASHFHRQAERITIAELREKYSGDRYCRLMGDPKLVATLFQ